MNIKSLGKKFFSTFPMLDCLFRRFVWKYIWRRVYFHENEMRFLNSLQVGSIDVAVDVGAAMGTYSWILNRASKQVYAFEPGNLHYRCLSRVAFWTNIEVIHAAVGSVCSRVSLYTPGSDSLALHSATLSQDNPVVGPTSTNVDQVDQITLDSFFVDKLFPSRTIDVLKVDVEGYELEVFRGSVEILSKHHPLIICEIEARHNGNYPEVFGLLKKLGYDCYIYRAGSYEPFTGERIEGLQLQKDFKVRLGTGYDPQSNRYINNFVFQHSQSRIKVRK